MAEVVKEHPQVNANKYDTYFDGRIWKLTGGVDCPENLLHARASICAVAKKLGVVAKVSMRKSENAIYVQAILGEGKP